MDSCSYPEVLLAVYSTGDTVLGQTSHRETFCTTHNLVLKSLFTGSKISHSIKIKNRNSSVTTWARLTQPSNFMTSSVQYKNNIFFLKKSSTHTFLTCKIWRFWPDAWKSAWSKNQFQKFSCNDTVFQARDGKRGNTHANSISNFSKIPHYTTHKSYSAPLILFHPTNMHTPLQNSF